MSLNKSPAPKLLSKYFPSTEKTKLMMCILLGKLKTQIYKFR